MIKEVKVPDIGNYENVPVIELLVKAGEHVKLNQGLLTLESDKATMEVPAPFDGIVRELKVKIGDSVSEGLVVALLEEAAAQTTHDATVNADSNKPLSTRTVSSESQVESKPTSDMAPHRVEAHSTTHAKRDHLSYASPSVRALARTLGVDLSQVTGTGRKNRITKEDVQKFLQTPRDAATNIATNSVQGLQLLPWPRTDFTQFGDIEQKPLGRIKKISGANLARNWAMIPHVTQQDEADITEMEAFRKTLSEQNKSVKMTPLLFLIKAAVAALKQFPHFNASLDASGEQLIYKKYFHIGIAVDTPDGLMVPVIRHCDQKGLLTLATELAEISAKARDKKLSPADMSGGCFTISSLGGIGGTGFTPIINAPEVAILGVSKSKMEPQWNGKEFTPRLMLPLSLSYDHRVIDGADAARFTAYIGKILTDIRHLLL